MDGAPAATAKNPLEILKQKVGPLPLGVWLIAGAAIWWYFQKQQSKGGSGSAVPNQQTDPAGNIGSIDPATGYVYGTPEDTAALAANNAGTSSPGGSAGQNATTGAQTYADNNTWGRAAVNYLVGLGIDPSTANQAITLYLASQPLTSAQQGDVNLAIQSLGAPPSLPGPVSSNPAPVTTPGGSGSPPVVPGQAYTSGGHVVSVSNNDAVVAWTGHNAVRYAAYIQGPGFPPKVPSTSGTTPQASFSGLQARHNYVVTVIPYNSAGKPGVKGTISLVTK